MKKEKLRPGCMCLCFAFVYVCVCVCVCADEYGHDQWHCGVEDRCVCVCDPVYVCVC